MSKNSTAIVAVETIDSALSEPASPDQLLVEARAVLDRHRATMTAYRGGLPAERQAAKEIRSEDRAEVRSIHMSGIGRRIDLIALLRQRDQQGRPVWTVADPKESVGRYNGIISGDGILHVGYHEVETGRPTGGGKTFDPSPLPPLPQEARDLATDPWIRRRASWVGVLYQPQTWREVHPDPAIVVEWKSRPGEYYCLAVWGGDRAVIEEFVH